MPPGEDQAYLYQNLAAWWKHSPAKVRKVNLSIDIKGEMKDSFILKVKDFFFLFHA